MEVNKDPKEKWDNGRKCMNKGNVMTKKRM